MRTTTLLVHRHVHIACCVARRRADREADMERGAAKGHTDHKGGNEVPP